ncbi:MAG: hypothetical protein HQK63_02590 [Desulfamplus sp.]|nr:hypothetical protein [Desulfamplus sp.]
MGGKRRKNNNEITISLFSFQDIITCLSGIMILLVLLIAVDIVTGQAIKSPQTLMQSSKSEESLKKELELEHLEKKMIQSERELADHQGKQKELNRKLAEQKKSLSNQKKAIAFIPAKDANPNQRAILIECSGKYIKTEFKKFSTDSNDIKEFIESLENLDKLRDYPVFIIKPSASDYAMELINQVQSIGFDVGYDAMAENESVENINNYE